MPSQSLNDAARTNHAGRQAEATLRSFIHRNTRLKKLLAEAELDKAMLEELAAGNL